MLTPTGLNEELVQLLLLRDELHVEQDAMLVDIEDLTRWIHLFFHIVALSHFLQSFRHSNVHLTFVPTGTLTDTRGTRRRKLCLNKKTLFPSLTFNFNV